mmetsp:Transcript_3051/g.11739  ORF Transcript_3051/g.11739 Transcript_3051/m.11739 type:complete len:303 (+) Transcript_3051:65-973(+)
MSVLASVFCIVTLVSFTLFHCPLLSSAQDVLGKTTDSPSHVVTCNSQFRAFLPTRIGSSEKHQIAWKESPFTSSEDTFICSIDSVSFYVRDTHLYYLLGFMSTFFSGNRVVGHLFDEQSYRKAQSLFFKGIRRNSDEIRLLTTPVHRNDVKEDNASRVYHLTKRHMQGAADVLFLQLDDLNAIQQAIKYTNGTNQKLILWRHTLEDIPVEKKNVIARIFGTFDALVDDMEKQVLLDMSQEFPEGVLINKIFDAHDLFDIEWMHWVEDQFKEEVRDIWERIKEGNTEKEHMMPFETYAGYEFK